MSEATARDRKGRFSKGNPGKPRGARHQTTRAVEDLLGKDALRLTRKAVKLALEGDAAALRLCLDRIAPVRKGRLIELARFPSVAGPEDVPAAMTSILDAVASGELTIEEADNFANLLGRLVAAHDAADFARRLADIERRIGLRNDQQND